MIRPALREQVRRLLLATGDPVDHAHVARALHEAGVVLGSTDLDALVSTLRLDTEGLGPLATLMDDEDVTDIVVNSPGDVRIDRGAGLESVAVTFDDEAAVRRLAQRLASRAGRRLDDAAPWVDARLPGGVRLHAVLPPISTAGTVISLRIPARRPLALPDLVARGSIAPSGVVWLERAVARRRNLLVVGGTGVGKTTVLGALLALVDQRDRIVVLEDSAELRPAHPHVVSLSARPANVEGAGEVRLRDLVRQSLRMRPDRIVVGEVRGDEVVDLLLAFNTGHSGGATTVHANSATEAPARLEALALAAGMHPQAIPRAVAAAVDVIVEIRRINGRRHVTALHRVVLEGGVLATVPMVDLPPGRDPVVHAAADGVLA